MLWVIEVAAKEVAGRTATDAPSKVPKAKTSLDDFNIFIKHLFLSYIYFTLPSVVRQDVYVKDLVGFIQCEELQPGLFSRRHEPE